MRALALFFSIAALCWASGAAPDEVRTTGGSVLVGRVVSIAGGTLTIETEFGGVVPIPMANVAAVTTDEPRTVRVGATHETQGTLRVEDGRQLLVKSDRYQPLSLAHLTVLQDLGVPIVEPPRANWTGRAELGLTGKSGNTDRIDARALVSATRTGERDRLMLTLRGAYAEVEGARSQNEVMGTQIYERDVSPRLFVFEKLELEYDEFENLDLRATLTGGLGYFLLRSERQELKVRGGLAYQHEEFSNGVSTSEDSFLAEFGYDYRLDVSKWFRYTSRFGYYFEPADVDEWRIDAENAAEIPLSQKSGWKLKFGVRNEYDNTPQPGIEELDTTYYTSLVYNWD